MSKDAAWVITYEDESTFSSGDGPPDYAPPDGVICITVADISCGNYVLAEQNYYCWHHGETPPQWVPHDENGLRQYHNFCGRDGYEPIVLSGYWIARERYARLRSNARKDQRLPKATANGPRQPEGI